MANHTAVAVTPEHSQINAIIDYIRNLGYLEITTDRQWVVDELKLYKAENNEHDQQFYILAPNMAKRYKAFSEGVSWLS